jgi:hypothetical protein
MGTSKVNKGTPSKKIVVEASLDFLSKDKALEASKCTQSKEKAIEATEATQNKEKATTSTKGTPSKDKALGEATKSTPNKDKVIEVFKGTLNKDKEKALEACKGATIKNKGLRKTKHMKPPSPLDDNKNIQKDEDNSSNMGNGIRR